MASVGVLQTRNTLNDSAGGTNGGVQDKTPMLQSWLQLFRSTTEQRKLQVKVAFNIENVIGLGGVHSELWAVNSLYVSF